MRLKFVDLFAGIGGFHLALSEGPIGAEFAWGAEIDEECRATYQAAFGASLHGDIRSITGQSMTADSDEGELAASVRASVPEHDVLCAGFPCQPFSKSGHQRGIAETRGTLFFDILAILQVRRPKFIVLENVMNLVGPRHRETWRTIIEQLRLLGYAVSDIPTVLSPHRLPLAFSGAPQHRERVFIPGIYVGGEALQRTAMGPLVPRQPFPDMPAWDLTAWLGRVESRQPPPPIRDEQFRAIDVWNDLLRDLEGPVPGVPIWGSVLTGDLRRSDEHPGWKNHTIAANERFMASNKPQIRAWLRRHSNLAQLHPSHRKLEWQAGGGVRDIWCHALQFRPSGIRVKPLTYLPALVAISQTSIIGPLRRRITVEEAARLQGFPPDFPFISQQARIYHQLGNAVSVGVTRFIAATLLLGTAGRSDYPAPLEWMAVRELADGL